ncbi:MAG: methyltransferase domain-containing protein [Patescibacteria group bacterium]
MQNFSGPKELIDHLDIYGPQTVVDFGAGAGLLALPLAKKLSPENGKLYAIDIQEGPLEVLRNAARKAHLYHVETLRGNLEKAGGSKLKDSIADWVFVANVLFQAPDKKTILEEAFRILKDHGTLVVVEWHPETVHMVGPKRETRIPKSTLFDIVRASGFASLREFTLGEHHHGLIAKKT